MMIEQEFNFATQTLGFTSVINARDIGGYKLPGGKTIKRGFLLRGGALDKANDDDLNTLANVYHLKHVFDFRTEKERAFNPDKTVHGSDSIWLPAIDENGNLANNQVVYKAFHSGLESYILEHSGDADLRQAAMDMYTDRVDNEYTQVQYASFLHNIVNTPEGAVYWHCSQGKDRTGLGATFLLAMLGADRDLILKDFDLSNEFYRDQVDSLCAKLAERGKGEDDFDVVKTFLGVNVKYYERALDLIDTKYGSMDEYLHDELLVDDDDIRILRERYLE